MPLKSKYLSIAQLAHLYMSIGKTIALTIQTFVSKVVSLLFNSLSRFVTAFTFKLWYWRRLLRVPWTARSNQSILKAINPEYSLEGLVLKLKLRYFGHLMRRADSLEKTLKLGKNEGRRRRRLTEDEMVGWHH